MTQLKHHEASSSSPDSHYPHYCDAHYFFGLTPGDKEGLPQQRMVFSIATDPLQDDKATEIQLLRFDRPHMRAFHLAWLSFFVAFFGWFSIPPLMPTIKTKLQLTNDEVYNSNIAAVASTILGRIVTGPLCDRYGARAVQATLLVVGALPVASAAFVVDYVGFMIVRFCIGLVGCSFIATVYWSSVMFSKEVVGSANALAAGWGNLGAGAAYLITPYLFGLLTSIPTISVDLGWRLVMIFPAMLMMMVGIYVYAYTDDCPHGNHHTAASRKNSMAVLGEGEPIPTEAKTHASLKEGLIHVCRMPLTWILAFQYACSFGVELQMHNVLSLFYYEDFTKADCDAAADINKCRLLSQAKASLISSLFGLMCIFARFLGGYASDIASRRAGHQGRLLVQFVTLTGEAFFLVLYSQIKSLTWSILCLVTFGGFLQACTGSTFGIVPYVSPRHTGAISGVIGAGGNMGALWWGLLFKAVGDRATAFKYLSACVFVAALLTGVIRLENEQPDVSEDDPSVHGSTAATVCADEYEEEDNGADVRYI